MSANPSDDVEPSTLTDPSDHSDIDDRYAAFTNDDGSVVIYDEDNDRAWIESDAAMTVVDMA